MSEPAQGAAPCIKVFLTLGISRNLRHKGKYLTVIPNLFWVLTIYCNEFYIFDQGVCYGINQQLIDYTFCYILDDLTYSASAGKIVLFVAQLCLA